MQCLSGAARYLIVAVVAMVGLAVPGVGVASTAGGGLSRPRDLPCDGAQVAVWMGLPGGLAAGSSYYQVEFSNVSATACTLEGFPGISGVTDDGTQIGRAAEWVDSSEPANVFLAPSATAHAVLQVADVDTYPPTRCKPAAAAGLRIYPPDGTVAALLPFRVEACRSGSAYLIVTAVRAGAGIPSDSR